MRRATLVTGVLFLLVSATGCGDTPRVVLRDTLNTWNEAADCMVEIVDEDSAQEIMKGKVEPLKKKWDGVTKRLQEFSKFDKEQKQDLLDTIEPLILEAGAATKRLKRQADRISDIRNRLAGKDSTNLSAAAKIPDLFKLSYVGNYDGSGSPDKLANPFEGLKPKLKK
jgi:hypothetical protein